MELSLIERTVWLLDDDQAFVDEFTLIFADAGFGFRAFLNTESFEAAWGIQSLPDLVLIDSRLHGRNSLDLIKSLRRQIGENIAIILLTEIDSESMTLNALKAGADDIFLKPISVAVLLARLTWHIRRVDSASQLTQQRNDFQTLVELSNGLNKHDNVPSILRTLIDGLLSSLGAESAAIYLRDQKSGELHRALPSGASVLEESRNAVLDLRDLQRISDGIVSKEILYLGPAETHVLKKAIGGTWVENANRTAAIFPLILNFKLTGILIITNRGEFYRRDREKYVASIIADFAARSVHRASLFDSIRTEHLRGDHTNKELGRAREYFRKLIMASPEGIVASDQGGAIFVMNTAAQKILGYGPNEFIGLTLADLYSEGDLNRTQRLIGDPTVGGIGVLYRHKSVLLDKSGNEIPVEISASTVFEEEEEVATVSFFVDQRHRIEMQEQLQVAHRSLEETQKKALVSELAGAAAHELNQPLTGLFGYVELLSRKMEGNEKVFASITKELNRIAEVVRKFGAITEYRTKPYVAGTQIIDLDLSSEAESHTPPLTTLELLEDLPLPAAVANEHGFLVQTNRSARTFLGVEPDNNPRLDLKARSTAKSVHLREDEIYLSDVRILDAGLQFSSLRMLPLDDGFSRIIFEVPTEQAMESQVKMLEVLSGAMHHIGLIRAPQKILELMANCFHKVFPDFGITVKFSDKAKVLSSPWAVEARDLDMTENGKEGHFTEEGQMQWQKSRYGYRIYLKNVSNTCLQIERKESKRFTLSDREAFQTFAQQLGFILSENDVNPLPLLDYIDAAIVICDSRRRVVVSNDTFDKLVGRPANGIDIVDFFEKTTRDTVSHAIATILANANAEPFDAALLSAERRSVNLRIQVHRNPGTIVGGFVLIGQQTEQSLLDLDQRMERAEQLVSLGQLATGVAHELKNPLMSILNYADYLHQKYSDSLFDPKDSQRLGRIVEGVEQIDGFVKDLLVLANPESFPQGRVSLRAALADAVIMNTIYIERHNVNVSIEENPDTFVNGNEIHLRQVFVNLVMNAACAMPKEGGNIDVSFESENARITCIFRDDAIGIAPDVLERIFEPFFTTRSGHGGSGLGLAIVKQIVKQHKGEILVNSKLGAGTTFRISFPSVGIE